MLKWLVFPFSQGWDITSSNADTKESSNLLPAMAGSEPRDFVNFGWQGLGYEDYEAEA